MKGMNNRYDESRSAGHVERRLQARRLWLRLVAILMLIVFVAAECATLLPEG